jgi:prepilin peptidase CpaA
MSALAEWTAEGQVLGAVLVAGAGAVADVRTRRIANSLTVTSAVVGLAVAGAVSTGWLPALRGVVFGDALACMLVTLALGIVFFTRGLLGGGDAKLLAAIAAWVGFPAMAYIAAYTVGAALVMVVVTCAVRGKTRALACSVVAVLVGCVLPALRRHLDRDLAGLTLPLGVAIWLGTCGWLVHASLAPCW